MEVVLHSYPLITAMANVATTLVSVCAEEGNSSLKVELKCSLVRYIIYFCVVYNFFQFTSPFYVRFDGPACVQIFVMIDIPFKFGISGKPGELSKEFAAAVVLLICVSIAGFARSCGL